MPRRKPEPVQDVVIPTTSLVASSMRYTGKAPRIYMPKEQWQHECYRHYAICGEARFAARFFGHAVSRAVLRAALVQPDGPEPQLAGAGVDALSALFNGKDGQVQMLDAIGTHLTIAGECYLVGRHTTDGDIWEVVSCIEMDVTGTNWTIKYGGNNPDIKLKDSDVVIRIWLPHPARRMEADSPFRALLPILSEIEYLTRHVFAQVTSRLAGAGILFLPQGMTFPPPPPVNGKEVVTANEADALMLSLADSMITSVADPGLPSALVPIVVTAPDDVIDKAKLMHFWSELDANALELRSEAIRRFALGMDLPPEQVLGMGSNPGSGGGTSNGVSHWGAWQIEEATIKMHVEPMLDVIVNAVTMGYLRPALDEPVVLEDGSDIWVIIYDTSSLRLRPDRSKEAFELYDRGLIHAMALRRETGFEEDDAPNEDEFKRWLLVKIASGSATPEQVQGALGMLGVALPVPAIQQGEPREARPDPSLEDHPVNELPDQAALLAACEGLVFRALERCGNRIRQKTGVKPPGIPSYEVHTLFQCNGDAELFLSDAWSCAPQVLEGLADVEATVQTLNSYCRALLAEQAPHTRARLSEWLSRTEVMA